MSLLKYGFMATILAGIVAVIALYASINAFTPYAPRDKGCVLKRGVMAGEDHTKFNDKSLLISSMRQPYTYEDDPYSPHFMWVLSGFKPGMTVEEVDKLELKKLEVKDWPEGVEFNTHGIYIRQEDRTLYAINHAYTHGGERIEVFKIQTDKDDIPNRLDYLYTITSDWQNEKANGLLNSILVVDKNKFYVTRFLPEWKSVKSPNTQVDLDIYHFMKNGYNTDVFFCDYTTGELKCTVATSGYRMANGITSNKDYTKVFVADLIGKALHVFDRNKETNELTKTDVIKTTSNIDNLKFDEQTGHVYGGGMNNIYQTF